MKCTSAVAFFSFFAAKRLGILVCILTVVLLANCKPPDKTPPGDVTNLTATPGNAQVALTWTNPGDSDFDGVTVVRKIGSAPANVQDGDVVYAGMAQTYTDTGLTNGTAYFYAVFTHDKAQNFSFGVHASATPNAPDTTPPANVSLFAATPGDGQVVLTWTNPGDADFSKVRIQRTVGVYATSPTQGDTVYDAAGQTFTDTGLTNETTYYYVAYAYDTASNFATGAQASAMPTVSGAQGEIEETYSVVNDALEDVPDSILDDPQKDSLQEKLDQSKQAYDQNDVCGAADALVDFLLLAQSYRQGLAVPTVEELYNLGRLLRYTMLLSAGKKAQCPGAEAVGATAEASVEGQPNDTSGVSPVITFGEPVLQSVDVDGAIYTEVEVPGTDAVMGDPGFPGVPVFRTLVAVPIGAQVAVDADAETAETIAMNLHPLQETPERQAWDDPLFPPPPLPFVIDAAAYLSNTAYPTEWVKAEDLGEVRGIHLVSIEVAAGQYTPQSNQLTLFSQVHLQVTFTGGTGQFVNAQNLSPFESPLPLYAGLALNGAALLAASQQPYTPPAVLVGEEFMILTPPAFRAAADRLAQWKMQKGIITAVYEVNDGPSESGPDTKEEIDQFIETEYDNSDLRPQYVLLLGDAEFIPPFYHPDPNPDPAHILPIATDWDYASHSGLGVDWIADFAVGRIPVDTLAQANGVVDKIIAYESTPPTNRAFYQNVSMAGQFDCCRRDNRFPGIDQWSFIYELETARPILTGRGYTVQRIYQESLRTSACPNPPCDPPIAAYTADTTPRRFNTGAFVTSDIGPGSGFVWTGTETDIRDAWNAGRLLIVHDDHAAASVWGTPRFTMPTIDALTNGGLQPVIFSINCQAGLFDNEISRAYGTTVDGVYFSERALRKTDGGAIGLIAATRNTPGPVTGEFFWGLIDAIWPNTIRGFNLPEPKHRLGDVLNHGKLYVLSLFGRSGVSGDLLNAMYLWNLTGDPTLEMWSAYPYDTTLPDPTSVEDLYDDHVLAVGYPLHGTVITAFYEGVPIGRGKVSGNSCPIYYPSSFELPRPAQVTLALAYPNAISRRVTVQTADRWPPAEVTDLTAISGDGQITLSWTNPVDTDFAGVLILGKDTGFPAHPTDGLSLYSGTDQTYTVTGLTNGSTHYYTVFTFDSLFNYSAGAQISATLATPDVTPPGNVKLFTAVGGDGQVVLSWTNPGDSDLAGVRIQRNTKTFPASPTEGVTVFNGLGAIFTDTDVSNGQTYYYTAFAYDEIPNYSSGAQAQATPSAPPDTTPPDNVTNLSASGQDTQISLAWTNPQNVDFAGVRIQRSEQGYPASIADGTTVFEGLQSSFVDTGLTNGVPYFYTVFTFDSSNNYASGAQTSASPQAADTTPPAEVSQLDAASQQGPIELTWQNPADADFAGVRIQRSEQGYPASIYDGITVYEGSAQTFTDTNVVIGTIYYYTVFTYDGVPNYSSGAQTDAMSK